MVGCDRVVCEVGAHNKYYSVGITVALSISVMGCGDYNTKGGSHLLARERGAAFYFTCIPKTLKNGFLDFKIHIHQTKARMNYTIAKDMQYSVGNEKYFKVFFPAEFQLFETVTKEGTTYNSGWVRDLQLKKNVLNAHNKMFLEKLVKNIFKTENTSFRLKKDAIQFILDHVNYE